MNIIIDNNKMTLDQRINGLAKLGETIRTLDTEAFDNLAESARQENPWFTSLSIKHALGGIARFLEPSKLSQWTTAYDLSHVSPKNIGLVMAGNIPAIGFHDLLTTLISGHRAIIKTSAKDSKLITFLMDALVKEEPEFKNYITIQNEFLKDFDAVIATGSDNSARYFEYYFRKYPHVIRKNRSSCAVLTGDETSEELIRLADDIFSYFGLGCRNVSKLFVPAGYDLINLLDQWESHKGIVNQHKYANNYDYQKSILLVNLHPFLDTGYVILQENEKLVSPIAVVYYEYYSDKMELQTQLKKYETKIQCIVGKSEYSTVAFGEAQNPEVWDYADGVDTLSFLSTLN